ncbi:putative protein disulfide-isomerase [Helianthus anomalus]
MVKLLAYHANASPTATLYTKASTSRLQKNRYVMVEFYATWCGHCMVLKPEYAAAPTELKADEVVLAKVDAGEETENNCGLCFRHKDAIVSWVKKKTGPGLQNVTTVEEAERILASESPIVVGYVENQAEIRSGRVCV